MIDSPAPPSLRLRLVIAVGVAAVLALAIGLYLRAATRTNHEALSAAPKLVTVVKARGGDFRPSRSYIGTLDPWNSARVGPQYVSAYVGSMLVRPGDPVKRGQVLGTLDCRGSNATSKATSSRARAIDEQQRALASEAARVQQLVQGGFASANEIERLTARSKAEAAELDSQMAALTSRTLEVDDCVLRAPFDGEVEERLVDPGAYVHPGTPIARIIDRSTIRIAASAPESDFTIVAAGTPVDIAVGATGQQLRAPISRRAPGADAVTRTVDFEIDIDNKAHALPSGATAVLTIAVGEPRPASQVPAPAATVRGDQAALFLVKDDGQVTRVTARVLGEREGLLFVDPQAVAPGRRVVVEGRALLEEGDHVVTKEVAP